MHHRHDQTRSFSKKMSRRTVVLLFAFVIVGLSGCVTNPSREEAAGQPSLERLLSDAERASANGRSDEAISILEQAAKANPTSMVPWSKIADIRFENGEYASAITAANEVLRRDAENQAAKSLLVVAGLRVAALAVSGLRPTDSVGAATRVEAEELTNALRLILGERELVPSSEAESIAVVQPPPARQSRKRSSHKRTQPAPRPKPAPARTDPFRALK